MCPNYEDSYELTTPKDPSWVDKWRKKALMNKVSLIIAFTVFQIIGTVFLIFFITTGLGGIVAFFMGFSYFLALCLLIAFITEIFAKRFAAKTIDGYSIVFYCGVHYNVFVEDELISNNPTQLVYPAKKQFIVTLPNGKVVNVDVYPRLKNVEIYSENRL